jgi:cellulase
MSQAMVDLVSYSYLIRAEMIGLHEADVSYAKNPLRGAQFYPNCVQIEVLGSGTVELPQGVSFPGAYSYNDPGVVYDVSIAQLHN